jgi:hypothetical protein
MKKVGINMERSLIDHPGELGQLEEAPIPYEDGNSLLAFPERPKPDLGPFLVYDLKLRKGGNLFVRRDSINSVGRVVGCRHDFR